MLPLRGREKSIIVSFFGFPHLAFNLDYTFLSILGQNMLRRLYVQQRWVISKGPIHLEL
jgi:hypothetical protein